MGRRWIVLTCVMLSAAMALGAPARPLYEPPVAVKPASHWLMPQKLSVVKAPEWSKYGKLRATEHQLEDGQPIYVLEADADDGPIYVTVNRGKSLAYYVGRNVAVYGPTLGAPDVSTRYLLATHVAVP